MGKFNLKDKGRLKKSHIAILTFLTIGAVGSLIPQEDLDSKSKENKESIEVKDKEVEKVVAKESVEDSDFYDSMKGVIIGKSNKDIDEVDKFQVRKVRNDKAGNFRLSTISEDVDIEEYVLSYSDKYIKDNKSEVHFIVNFYRKTTTMISHAGELTYVDIKEHVKKEEHDAKKLGNGMTLANFVIFPDGDIQAIDPFAED